MRLVDRIAARWGYEKRAAVSASWAALQAIGGHGGGSRLAENLAGVSACVSAIATALASAPMLVYRRTASGRVEVPDHPVAELLRRGPNAVQSTPELVETWIAGTLLHGNGLIEIDRRGAEVAGLRYVPWGWVSASLGPSGRLVYDVNEQSGLHGQTGRIRRLLASDAVHLKDRSDDGLLGRSRLSRSADTVDAALALNERMRSTVANGAAPSGVVSGDGMMSPQALEALRSGLEERHTGAGNAGRVMVLMDGLKFTPLMLTPEDSELLASRKFALEELCRLFQVPPPLVGVLDHSSFTNSETAGRWFATFTLAPWARKVEAAMTRALFPEGSGLEVELDLSAFMRGDPEARWAAHKIAVEAGILTPDEVREVEGYNPRGAVEAMA